MNDAEYEAQKDRIEALREKWVKPLGLGWWRIVIDYVRQGWPRTEEQEATSSYPIMECAVRWEYLQAMIKVNVPELVDMDDDRLEECFVHELCHIFVNELREVSPDHDGWIKHEERVVTHLAHAFLWLRKHVEDTHAVSQQGSGAILLCEAAQTGKEVG